MKERRLRSLVAVCTVLVCLRQCDCACDCIGVCLMSANLSRYVFDSINVSDTPLFHGWQSLQLRFVLQRKRLSGASIDCLFPTATVTDVHTSFIISISL